MARKSEKQLLKETCDKQSMTMDSLCKQISAMQKCIESQAETINKYKQYMDIRSAEGKKSQIREIRKTKYFHKAYTRELIELINSKTLTIAQQRILFCTTPFLEKKTNFVLNNNGQRANKKDILEIVGMDKKLFDEALSGLQEMGIMFKIPLSRNRVNFLINAKYFYIGDDNSIWAESEEIKELLKPGNTVD